LSRYAGRLLGLPELDRDAQARDRKPAQTLRSRSSRGPRGLMPEPLPDAALDQLFREARSYNAWLDEEVTDAQIRAIYDLMKMGPTSANQQPARLVWCRSPEAKARLAAHASEANRPKITGAPVCVIVGMDLEFHEQLPWLFPHTDARRWFLNEELRP